MYNYYITFAFQPTFNYGAACNQLSSADYLNSCNYSAAYELMNFIYGGNLTVSLTNTLWSYHYGNLGLVTHFGVIVKLPLNKHPGKPHV